jgi:hypothetical protein
MLSGQQFRLIYLVQVPNWSHQRGWQESDTRGQSGTDVAEGTPDGGRESPHRGRRAQRDQRCDQGVFDKILTGFIAPKLAENPVEIIHYIASIP